MASLPTPPLETIPLQEEPNPDLSSLPPFQMSFSIKLHCESCVSSVQKAVLAVPGISSAELSLEHQTLTTLGTAAPSSILAAIQTTGRDAIVRGTGGSSSTNGSGKGQSAAVAILEDYDTDDWSSSPVRGLARIVQVSSPQQRQQDGAGALSVVDISLSGLRKGLYQASIRSTGDISKGSRSVGNSWRNVGAKLEVGDDGKQSAVVVEQGWEVWEIVGRAFAVERVDGDGEDKQMVLGVIARSAGVWDNDKMVCSCSGKTVWEERVEQKGRGML